jgi:hypothetical protein
LSERDRELRGGGEREEWLALRHRPFTLFRENKTHSQALLSGSFSQAQFSERSRATLAEVPGSESEGRSDGRKARATWTKKGTPSAVVVVVVGSCCLRVTSPFFLSFSNVLVDVHLVALIRRLVLPVGVPPVGMGKREQREGEKMGTLL